MQRGLPTYTTMAFMITQARPTKHHKYTQHHSEPGRHEQQAPLV